MPGEENGRAGAAQEGSGGVPAGVLRDAPRQEIFYRTRSCRNPRVYEGTGSDLIGAEKYEKISASERVRTGPGRSGTGKAQDAGKRIFIFCSCSDWIGRVRQGPRRALLRRQKCGSERDGTERT